MRRPLGAHHAQTSARPSAPLAALIAVLAAPPAAGARRRRRRTTSWSSPRPPASGTTRSPAGIQAIRDLGAANNFTVTATEDATAFTTANLAQYEAVVFLNTTGDVLNATQQTAFESYIRGGGGYVGVHAAADTEYDWPFYGNLVGAYFASHPAIQQANVKVENRAHAATAHLPQTWTRTDEWYNYQTNPRSTARVLATLDESSYSGGGMGADHPHHLVQDVSTAAGRSTPASGTPRRRTPSRRSAPHLLGGIRYAAGRTKADCRPETGYTTLYNGSTTGWSQAGPGSFTNTDATLTSVGGMGLFWYSAKQFTLVLAEAGLEDARRRQLRRLHRLPAVDRPVVGGEQRLRDPDRRHRRGRPHHRRRSTRFKSADIAARDAALNPPGEWNTYELLVEGERLQVYLNGVQINDFTNTDPVRVAGRLHRHPEPRHRRRRVVPQHPDQGAGRAAAGRRRDRAGRVVHLGRAACRRSPRPAPTTARRSATSTRATGPRTTGVNLGRRDHRSGPGSSPAAPGGTHPGPHRLDHRPDPRLGGGAEHRRLEHLRQRHRPR